MLNELWRKFLGLPQWQQAGGTTLALIAAWVAVRSGTSLLTRSSRRTLYVLDETGHSVGRERRDALPTPNVNSLPAPPATAPAPADGDTPAGGRHAPPDDQRTLSADQLTPPTDQRTPPANETEDQPANIDWADNRGLCACCGYPTATDEFNAQCVLCDWREPESDDSPLAGFSYRELTPVVQPLVQPGVGSEERDQELELAKQNFAKYGSALAPADRMPEDFPLTSRRVAARRDLRERFEYLKTDPPDISETWDTIDALITGLREENE